MRSGEPGVSRARRRSQEVRESHSSRALRCCRPRTRSDALTSITSSDVICSTPPVVQRDALCLSPLYSLFLPGPARSRGLARVCLPGRRPKEAGAQPPRAWGDGAGKPTCIPPGARPLPISGRPRTPSASETTPSAHNVPAPDRRRPRPCASILQLTLRRATILVPVYEMPPRTTPLHNQRLSGSPAASRLQHEYNSIELEAIDQPMPRACVQNTFLRTPPHVRRRVGLTAARHRYRTSPSLTLAPTSTPPPVPRKCHDPTSSAFYRATPACCALPVVSRAAAQRIRAYVIWRLRDNAEASTIVVPGRCAGAAAVHAHIVHPGRSVHPAVPATLNDRRPVPRLQPPGVPVVPQGQRSRNPRASMSFSGAYVIMADAHTRSVAALVRRLLDRATTTC